MSHFDGTASLWDDNWTARARCRDRPDEMFVRGSEQHRAKAVCAGCPVRAECLSEALDDRLEWGVWGGMTERERRAVLRKRPNIRSWRRVLGAAYLSDDDTRAPTS
jgi:WhiB family redox-sensing transcriptional regulator